MQQLLEFLAPYGPAITDLTLAVRAMVRKEAPDATELIYDAYNAVAIGYSFTGRPSDGFIHIAVYRDWVNLGFNWGVLLKDPKGILHGTGNRIRHIRINSQADLKVPHVRAFVKAAIAKAERSGKNEQAGKSVVRAVYAKRRRPA